MPAIVIDEVRLSVVVLRFSDNVRHCRAIGLEDALELERRQHPVQNSVVSSRLEVLVRFAVFFENQNSSVLPC